MSEPLSSVEIEDVLSSIRRLVSEDLWPVARVVPVPPPEPAKPALILTPALRVVVADPAPTEVYSHDTTHAADRERPWAQSDGDWAAPGDDVTDESSGRDSADDDHGAPQPMSAEAVTPFGDVEAAWADQAEAEVIAALEQPEPPGAEPRFHRGDDGPEMSFDEEVLRDLVRDLIREELQGHLGERITRNVRKLVRAEIARALASAEFE